ncbi:MAG: hypothetical protein ACLUHA_16125 [Bacteroides stercoris]
MTEALPTWVMPKLNEIRNSNGIDSNAAAKATSYGYWAPSVQKVRNWTDIACTTSIVMYRLIKMETGNGKQWRL